MKKFYYDTLIDRENICNLIKERKTIETAVAKGSKLVVYGPRNYGKTSLVKNVVLADFAAQHKKSFIFFADLMEVKSLASINQRISKGFEISFVRSFPAKSLMEGVKQFLSSLRPQVTFESNTGVPTLSISADSSNKEASCEEIFRTIKEISKDRKTIIALDEFQDIAFVDEAQGLFRRIFQEIKDVPIIVMGSKRHILADILAKHSAPFSMFGEEIEFKPISYEEYHEYIEERFGKRRLTISFDDCKYLQDMVLRVPEAINIVCAEIMEEYENKKITSENIGLAAKSVVEKRQGRYEEYLSNFTENEESILASLSKIGLVKHPNSIEFLRTVKPTSRMVGLIFKQFMNKAILDKNHEGYYYISDPLFSLYIKNHR